MEFSLIRLKDLLKKQWVENQKLYLLGILAMIGIMAVALLLAIENDRGLTTESQQSIFLTGLAVLGFIFSTTLLNRFSDKIQGIEALMLPASALEKVIAAVIYSLVFFPLVYFMTVYSTVILMHLVDTRLADNFNLLYQPGKTEAAFLPGFLLLQSFSLLCSIMFRRFVFLKAVIVGIIIVFGVIYLNLLITENYFKGLQPRHISVQQGDPVVFSYYNSFPYQTMQFIKSPPNSIYELKLPEHQNMIFKIIFLLPIPFFWLLIWLKLREKQL